MKNQSLVGIAVIGLIMGATMTAQAKTVSLSEFRGKNRILVVVGPSAQDSSLIAQRRIFQQASTGMAERDVVLVEAAGNDDRARDIRSHLSISGDSFRAVLVCKDGNSAFSTAKPVTAAELFGKIDAMPMRRDEMRKQK